MAKQNQKLKVEKFRGKYPFKRGLHLAGDYSFAGPILQAIDRFRFTNNNLLLSKLNAYYHQGYSHVIIYLQEDVQNESI